MATSCKRFVLGFVVVLLSLPSVECDADERNVLLEIKKSLRNVEWTDTPSSDYCGWRGIGCDKVTFNVVALNLSGLQLEGEISPAIGQLKSLISINLSGNRLAGQIPDEIGDCSALESLDLSSNELYGDIPSSISKLKRLENLDLHLNRLNGEIPRLLFRNEALGYLALQHNNLQGSLSPDMCQLTHLWFFDVRNNSLSGPIPQSIGDCTSFQILVLSHNNFTGDIPFSIGFLQLGTLNLGHNHFSGQIPLEFGLLQSLITLDLSFNMLNGSIPPTLGNLSFAETFYLQGNKLTGPIPVEIANMTKLQYLELSDNQLTGHIPPQLGKLIGLLQLDLSNNDLSGLIPKELGQLQHLSTLNLKYNNISGGVMPLTNCSSLTVLNVSYNNLAGSIPTINNFSSRFSPESFLGNPGLCGYWFSSNCFATTPHPRPRHTEPGSKSKAGVLGLTLVVIFLVVVIVAWRLHHPKSSNTTGPPDRPVNSSSPELVILHINMDHHVYEDIMRMTEYLSERFVVGHGASSTVYKCHLKNYSRPVAVKKLHAHVYPLRPEEFKTRLNALGSIKHRNLVSLQGYSLSRLEDLLFFDYMENGSLCDILHGTMKKKLGWSTRLRVALGAAQGLVYLHHECSPQIIHGNVKSSNILLDKDYQACLTDYGIAQSLSTSNTRNLTFLMGDIRCINPEYARPDLLTDKSDVYSYGNVLLELLTGWEPVDSESNLHQLILGETVNNNSVMENVDPEISETCSDIEDIKEVFQLALWCTKREPSDRPAMNEVVRVLESLMPLQDTELLASTPPAPLPWGKGDFYVGESSKGANQAST